MPEYIEREATIKAVCCYPLLNPEPNDIIPVVLGIVRKGISLVPAAEVEPVRHGRWEEYQLPHIICCSVCDWGTGPDEKTPYCPQCGAKMDLTQ